MFLGCIAKALTVQLKAKGTTITGTAGTAAGKGVTTVTLPMIFNSRLVKTVFCQAEHTDRSENLK